MHHNTLGETISNKLANTYRVSQKDRAAFVKLLFHEHISNDILQYLIE